MIVFFSLVGGKGRRSSPEIFILKTHFVMNSDAVMRRWNCSVPIHPPPPWHPRGHHFFGGCLGLFNTLFLPCLALIHPFDPFIFQWFALFSLPFPVPALFYHSNFSSVPGLPDGRMGAEKFDRPIMTWIIHRRTKIQLTKSKFWHSFENLVYRKY